MAALIDRGRVEATFANKLSRLNSRHRKELESLLGNPPNIDSVPEAFWQRVEDETSELVASMLILIFIASSTQHGGNASDSQRQAQTYGTQRAAQIARIHRRESARKLRAFAERTSKKIANKRRQNQRRVERAQSRIARTQEKLRATLADQKSADDGVKAERLRREINDAKATLEKAAREKTPKVLKKEIRSATIDAFGPDRANRVATTGTTQAASAGSEFAIQQTVGFSEADMWFTENDERVCPVCAPLHGTFRRVWSQQFPNGPPAHSPGSYPIDAPCRCWISYENEKLSRDDKVRFKKLLKQAQQRGDTTKPFPARPGDPVGKL